MRRATRGGYATLLALICATGCNGNAMYQPVQLEPGELYASAELHPPSNHSPVQAASRVGIGLGPVEVSAMGTSTLWATDPSGTGSARWSAGGSIARVQKSKPWGVLSWLTLVRGTSKMSFEYIYDRTALGGQLLDLTDPAIQGTRIGHRGHGEWIVSRETRRRGVALYMGLGALYSFQRYRLAQRADQDMHRIFMTGRGGVLLFVEPDVFAFQIESSSRLPLFSTKKPARGYGVGYEVMYTTLGFRAYIDPFGRRRGWGFR